MIKPCVIGFGYVGLPIQINLSKKYDLINSKNEFLKFDIYTLLTNHSIINKDLKLLPKNKIIINLFGK